MTLRAWRAAFFAISRLLIVCRDAIMSIAVAINITVAIRVAPAKPGISLSDLALPVPHYGIV